MFRHCKALPVRRVNKVCRANRALPVHRVNRVCRANRAPRESAVLTVRTAPPPTTSGLHRATRAPKTTSSPHCKDSRVRRVNKDLRASVASRVRKVSVVNRVPKVNVVSRGLPDRMALPLRKSPNC